MTKRVSGRRIVAGVLLAVLIASSVFDTARGDSDITDERMAELKNGVVYVRIEVPPEYNPGFPSATSFRPWRNGFLFHVDGKSGYIVTLRSERMNPSTGQWMQPPATIVLRDADGKVIEAKGEFLGTLPKSGISIVKITADRLPTPIAFAEVSKLRETMTVFVVGFPHGAGEVPVQAIPNRPTKADPQSFPYLEQPKYKTEEKKAYYPIKEEPKKEDYPPIKTELKKEFKTPTKIDEKNETKAATPPTVLPPRLAAPFIETAAITRINPQENAAADIELDGVPLRCQGGCVVSRKGDCLGILVVNSTTGGPILMTGPELQRMLNGTIERTAMLTMRVEGPIADVTASVGLIDPFRKIRGVTLYYARKSTVVVSPTPRADGSWPPLTGTRAVKMTLDDSKATTDFRMKGIVADEADYLYQIGLTDMEGKESRSAPLPFKLDFAAIPRRVGAPKEPPAPTDLKGLIAYWSFDEGKGESVANSADKENPAKLIGGEWSKGIRGQAISLDGKAYCDLGTSEVLNFGDKAPFTITGWFKGKNVVGAIFSFRNSKSGSPVIDIISTGNGVYVTLRADGNEFGDGRAGSNDAVGDDEWHHFAVLRDPEGGIELYVDGLSRAKGTSRNTRGPITTDLRAIGSERYHARTFRTDNLRGMVDEVCVFDRLLDAKEIIRLAGRELPPLKDAD